jgi:hypothetical protein
MNTKKNIQRKTKKNISKRKRRTTNRSRVQKQVAGYDLGIKKFMKNLFLSNRPKNDLRDAHLKKEESMIFRDVTPTFKRFYKIYGMGCDASIEQNIENVDRYKKSTLKNIKLQFVNELKLNEEDVQIVCDKSIRAIHNIYVLWSNKPSQLDVIVQQSLPLVKSQVFTDLVNNILQDLKQGKRVYVNGHSFGGAIANNLAVKMQEILRDSGADNTLKNNITKNFKINAFGSIFVAPFEKTKDIPITNYLAVGDVAQKLNNMTEPMPNEFGNMQSINDVNAYLDVLRITRGNELKKTINLISQGAINFNKLMVYFKRKEKEQQSSVVWIDHYMNANERLIDRFIREKGDEPSGTFGNKLEWGIHNLYSGLDRQLRKSFQ